MNIKRNTDIYGITANSIKKYLILSGWEQDIKFKNKKLMVFLSSKYKMRIALPASEKFIDFYPRLLDILETLSNLERKDLDLVTKEVLTVYFDRVEFRIISDISKNGKLPLDYASNCIDGLKNLFLYSACAEEKKQPVCQRATQSAQRYLDNFELDQTERGSFIISIDAKVIDEQADRLKQISYLKDDESNTSFEHRVMKRVCNAITQIDEVAERKKSLTEVTKEGYKSGATANICESLLKLNPGVGDIEVETTIRYASILTKNTNIDKQIKIKNNHFWAMDEISKIYRDELIVEDVVLKGMIQSLNKKVDDFSDNYVRLFTYHRGKHRIVRMSLSNDDYKIACNAHRDELEVEVEGELDMETQRWSLKKIKSFKIL